MTMPHLPYRPNQPGSVAWAARRIRALLDREEQERLARPRRPAPAVPAGIAANSDAIPGPTLFSSGLLDPRLWTDEHYRAMQSRPASMSAPYLRNGEPGARRQWLWQPGPEVDPGFRRPYDPLRPVEPPLDPAAQRPGRHPGGTSAIALRAVPDKTAGPSIGPSRVTAGPSIRPAPVASARSTGYHERINPELGGSRTRHAHLIYAGRSSAHPPYGDVYDQTTPYGRIARHIYANDPISPTDWETWPTPVARSPWLPPSAATEDAIGVMLTEFYRQHLDKYRRPPDWPTLMEHHRQAYRTFGAPMWLPGAADQMPSLFGAWATTPDSSAPQFHPESW